MRKLLDRLSLRKYPPSARLLFAVAGVLMVGGFTTVLFHQQRLGAIAAISGFAVWHAAPSTAAWKETNIDPFAERPVRAACAVLAWVGWFLLVFGQTLGEKGWGPAGPMALLLLGGAAAVFGAVAESRLSASASPAEDEPSSLPSSRLAVHLPLLALALFLLAALSSLLLVPAARLLGWPLATAKSGWAVAGAFAAVAATAVAFGGARCEPFTLRMRAALGESSGLLYWASFIVFLLTILCTSPDAWRYWLSGAVGLFLTALLLAAGYYRLRRSTSESGPPLPPVTGR